MVKQATRRIVKQNGILINNSGMVINNFRSRQLAEVLKILKRPEPLDSETYEGD